ncbi:MULTISPECIES: hypothetical protein [unclassified Ruegeria]|uniref:hypothetical protein n=1 Tax=unclassified Ruegeria TaxID=2625375 RepID=UPI001488B495|nr:MULTISPECIES: hypothetical protein [unclassified Ruegeria]
MYRYVLTTLALFFASLLHAAGMERWGETGDWTILIDPEKGNGCLAWKPFENDMTVEIGAAPNQAGGFFAAFNPAWIQIEDGATGVVQFDFGDAKFEGEAVGVFKNGVPGGYAFFDNPAFVTEFGKRQSVTIIGESGAEVELDLSGSAKAIEAVLACQAEQPEPLKN